MRFLHFHKPILKPCIYISLYLNFVFLLWYFIKGGSPNCVRPRRTWISSIFGLMWSRREGLLYLDKQVCDYFSGSSVSLAMYPISAWGLAAMWSFAIEAWDQNLMSLLLAPLRTKRCLITDLATSKASSICHSYCDFRASLLLPLLPLQWSPSHLLSLMPDSYFFF